MLKGDLAERLTQVSRRGGSVLATFLSGRVDEDDNAFLMDVPGPLGALLGIRIDEWDAREAEVVNPVRLGDVEVPARLVFEIVIPQGAETVGTYQADFYAGTPAVTRNVVGDGDAWYVATALDQEGVSLVVQQILDRHGLRGPYPDVAGLETARRVAPDGRCLLFLLNHGSEPLQVIAGEDAVDLLTGVRLERGQPIHLDPYGVAVLQ
jgi:beta-galactosidase